MRAIAALAVTMTVAGASAPSEPAVASQAQTERGGVIMVGGIVVAAGVIALVASTAQGDGSISSKRYW
ncbi:MAG TPA: hypothetical protein VGM26_11195 [Rhizomicrobium sp.]|jgi:uncharacterized membrane protein